MYTTVHKRHAMNTPPQTPPPPSPISRDASPPRLQRAWTSLHSFAQHLQEEDDGPVLEENVPDKINDWNVRFSRSQPRVGGIVCVEVEISRTGKVEKWPLEAFVDGDEFTNETVCEMVNDWNATASAWPNVKRLCLMCRRRATKGLTICGPCEREGWGLIIYG